MQRVKQLLDYMHSNPFVKIRFRASDIILNIHSDASYLSAGKDRSCAGRCFFLGSLPCDYEPIWLNRNIHITCAILKLVAASTAEAELGALFLNGQEAKIVCLILEEIGHPQPPIPICGQHCHRMNSTIKHQRSRAFEMRYSYLLDRAV